MDKLLVSLAKGSSHVQRMVESASQTFDLRDARTFQICRELLEVEDRFVEESNTIDIKVWYNSIFKCLEKASRVRSQWKQ